MWCLLSVIVPAPSGVVTFFVSFVSTNWEVRKFPNPFSNIELYEFSSGWAAIAGVDHSVAVGDVGIEALVGARTRTSSQPYTGSGIFFVEFFQKDRNGNSKGIEAAGSS